MSTASMLLPQMLLEAAETHADRPAVVAGDRRLTYAELCSQAASLAAALRSRGVGRGDRVAIFMDNAPEYAVALFGAWLADAVVVPIHFQVKSAKLGWILRHSGAVALLTDTHLEKAYGPAIQELNLRTVLVARGSAASSGVVEPLERALSTNALDVTPLNAATDIAAILYTSGTSGAPKGVVHTLDSLSFACESVATYLGIVPEDRVFCGLPLSFGYGLFQLLPAVARGAALVLGGSSTYPADLFRRMHAERITTFAGVPTTFAMMLSHDAKTPLSFPSVRLVTNAGAALPEPFIPGILRMFPSAGLVKMYGQTECIRAAYLPSELATAHPSAVGRAIPGSEVLVLDENGRAVATGEVGTLHVRGRQVMKGYWNDPERTAEALVPGPSPGEVMLRTGDHFRMDEAGLLYFVGRQDDIIKSRGEKVSPTEVESAIYRLPAVDQAVVLGVPDPILGAAVCAVVTKKPGATLEERDVKRVCAEVLEGYMVPSRVLIVDELPRTATGKLSRKLVYDELGPLLEAPRAHASHTVLGSSST